MVQVLLSRIDLISSSMALFPQFCICRKRSLFKGFGILFQKICKCWLHILHSIFTFLYLDLVSFSSFIIRSWYFSVYFGFHVDIDRVGWKNGSKKVNTWWKVVDNAFWNIDNVLVDVTRKEKVNPGWQRVVKRENNK